MISLIVARILQYVNTCAKHVPAFTCLLPLPHPSGVDARAWRSKGVFVALVGLTERAKILHILPVRGILCWTVDTP